MGRLAELRAGMRLAVRSPDGLTAVTLTGGDRVGIRLAPGSFPPRSIVEFTATLNRMVTDLWQAYRRRSAQARTELAPGLCVMPETAQATWNQATSIVGNGLSGHGYVGVETLALRRWRFGIHEAAETDLTAPEFTGEFTEAVAAAIADFRHQAAQARQLPFGRLPTFDRRR
jgi:hypothetical protein